MRHAFGRATKIVATLGPASRNPDTLRRMIDAGMSVARINFSHGDRDDHRASVELIRAIAAEKGRAIGILQDLQGPKIRVARFEDEGGILLEPGDLFSITMDNEPGNKQRVGTTYKGLAADVRPGMTLLLDDGNLALRVLKVLEGEVQTRVLVGGPLKNNKGINVPEAELSVPALSDKDVSDLEFGACLLYTSPSPRD